MIWFQRYGAGPRTYLALHGWSGSHRTFEPLLPWMPDDVTLIAVDLPGYGRSPVTRPLTLEQIREALLVCLEQLGDTRVTLLGNCSGALLGLFTALEAPERFERFVLIDVFAFLPPYFKILLMPVAGRFFYYSAFANPLGRYLTNLGLKDNRAEGTDMVQSFRESKHSVVYRYLQQMSRVTSIDVFASLQCPTTLLHGERTFPEIRESVPLWEAMWPHLQLCELQGAGHLPIQETPELLARAAFSPVVQSTSPTSIKEP